MPFKKGFTSVKKPTITVQTKKMTDGDCCSMKSHHCGKFVLIILLVVNILLTLSVLVQQKRIESMRVGGRENYKMLQQVFTSEGFQAQQKQQIQQAMQLYQINPDVVKTPSSNTAPTQ